ncbi:MAG: Crossover junction endodeoxyribonuclease RuvC [Chlamydiia bacterium]|nr:Crossover junction endodeoxyribonuclease RuvC [Chlamydiia bacterium]MCH9616250.1 Crossover junction endodeoxyribonuclease RuvC [Chlamydiia bacterium]MCH9629764.1 Crossover junction endodeoxyribonuclease RuvC [Chlamydiia bacterium]
MPIVLGIDPGTLSTGYALINDEEILDLGCIKPPRKLPLNDRYLIIFEALEHLIEKYSPTVLAVETQYMHKNPQSALKLGMARGVVIVAAAKQGLSIHEYAPTKAKIAVTGSGRASKEQMQKMIQMLYDLDEAPPHDAADAVALARCYTQGLTCTTTFAAP